jgi:nucleoside-diphosphate-sugar epimerase
MNEALSGLIQIARDVAPPGGTHLDEVTMRQLRGLTRALIAASPDAAAEHARFLAIAQRGLSLPEAEVADRLRGATVLVTGGTGCVGSALMAQVAARRPARLVSVSRGVTGAGWPRIDDAEYLSADIRDIMSLCGLVAAVRPDVIFHVAAQRDPGLAEREVHRTVSTNVLGTRNVLAAARRGGVRQVVHASAGKALRPYSPETYTASKRAAEWLLAETALRSDLLCSAARFTHVVDNSIIYRRLRAWAADAGAARGGRDRTGSPAAAGLIRLHSPDIAFYAQSALESAQLLLLACAGARRGEFLVHAITDLGWPVSLLDLALAVVAEHGSRTALYFSGYDAGYEEVPFPGLYSPLTADDVSPLLNAYEAAALTGGTTAVAGVDQFRLEFAQDGRRGKLLLALDGCCEQSRDPGLLRGALGELSWSLLDGTLRAAPPEALARSARIAKAHWDTMSPDHRRVLEAICDAAAADGTDTADGTGYR